jgi:hypothetical protein
VAGGYDEERRSNHTRSSQIVNLVNGRQEYDSIENAVDSKVSTSPKECMGEIIGRDGGTTPSHTGSLR